MVKRWSQGGWQGTTARTRKLLEFWESSDPGAGMRPFWCQMEAVQTMIWLFEAGKAHDPNFHGMVMERLAAANHTYNEGVPRAAFKMATGTGKTNVMAMTILWIMVNRAKQDDAANFLVIAPNLAVKKRLDVLHPKKGTDLWDAITPREFHGILGRAQVTVVNFHVFQRRTATMDGKPLGSQEKHMLGKSSLENFRESRKETIRRILRDHTKGSKITVINDEAHHCYMPTGTPVPREDREYQEAAAVWFSAVKTLKEQGRLEQVYDFSATPMWLSRPRELESEIFPWTVSDFSLLDAIESGLVKIPRVPVRDDTGSHQAKYRNVYEYNSGRNLTRNLAVPVREPLKQLYAHYHGVVEPAYSGEGIVPVFIVVANTIKNAAVLYRWIAGSGSDSGGTRGNLELFSNYGMDGSRVAHPPTLLVHSRLFDRTPVAGPEKEMVGEMAALFGLEGSLDDKQERIRDLFTSVGRGDARHIRCVISVGMLTEGWDAKNVTHVFGYRRFGSLLLCEQVTGRALRRTSFVGAGRQKPEYANVFGIPYTFARGGETEPQPPAQSYRVFSVPGRERFRIRFPNVAGYENPKRRRRFRLNPKKVERYVVEPGEPRTTEVDGPMGEGITTRRDRRDQTAVWETAGRVSALLNRDSADDMAEGFVAAGRRLSFVDACGMVRGWLSHPDVACRDVAGMAADPNVPQQIAEACEYDDEDIRARPIFADWDRSGERLLTTEGVGFRTTLQHVYMDVRRGGDAVVDGYDMGEDPDTFLAKSELSRAACHTQEEARIAKILDNHPGIEAWARNFRLDFRIPWFDAEQGMWRHVEPDFVARVKTGDDKPLHLVIEFKGLKKGEAQEQAKKMYIRDWWCPAVSGYGEYGRWRVVWIEDGSAARRLISEGCA